jgi:hypothetical protein
MSARNVKQLRSRQLPCQGILNRLTKRIECGRRWNGWFHFLIVHSNEFGTFSSCGYSLFPTICIKTLMNDSQEHRDQIPYSLSRVEDQSDDKSICVLTTVRCRPSPMHPGLWPKYDISLDSEASFSYYDRQWLRLIGSPNRSHAFATTLSSPHYSISVPSDCHKAVAALDPEIPPPRCM